MKAFTLIEILVGAVVLILLMMGVFSILSISNNDWFLETGLLNVTQQARQAMQGMVRELRQSDHSNVTIINNGETIDFTIPNNISATPITYYQPIRYSSSNNQIFREHPTGNSAVLASYVKDLDFCLWDGSDCCDEATEDCSGLHIIQISLEAERTIKQRTLSFLLTEKVRLRNE